MDPESLDSREPGSFPKTRMAGARRKRTRAQPNLTSERIREEALKLIEAEGLDAFSTRKLGRALGVEAMAIYWYYPSKDALLDAVVERLVGTLDAPSAQPRDFVDALRRLAHAYRGLAHAYPNAFPLLATRRFATEGTHRFLDDIFGLAEHHGLDARTTARYYRLVASFCNGVALDELAGIKELETRHDAKETRSRLPRLARVFDYLAPEHYEDLFTFGLDVLLRSVAEHAKKPRAPKSKPSTKPTRRGGRS
jgi:AcrR family transcriptional regulator